MVAYRVPQPTKEEWIRSHAGLYGSRVLYLGQEIDDEEMNRVIAELLFLDAEEVANQYLYINSPGGSVTAGFALYDVMQHVGSRCHGEHRDGGVDGVVHPRRRRARQARRALSA